MRKTESQKIALCGVLGALSVVLLLVGAALQIGTYAAPMLAAFLLIPVLDEYGPKYALLLYATVSILSVLLVPELELATGETSKKLGRGRHTTRHVELYPVEGGYVADTPGFSTMDIERYELFRKEELPEGFREFAPYLGECKFTSCSHTCEKGCAVLKAVEEGKISRSRIDSYIAMYNEVKDIKEWQLSKTKNV